jgi:AcrR family transcriptional regulator
MFKKQLIMEKALELFAENGFNATSVQQITERCGISKGAFYLSFKSKDDLIFGLIDHILNEFIVDIEQAVNKDQPAEDLLFNYFYVCFNSFNKRVDFAKLFMKEQPPSVNSELLEKMEAYNSMLNEIVLSIVKRQFSYTNPHLHADLVYVIRGFIKSYGELFLKDEYPMDLTVLCKSLVEKSTVIAEHATIQFISPEYLTSMRGNHAPSKEQIIELLSEKTKEIEENQIIEESLELLREDLIEPKLNIVIIHGLLNNIRTNPHCKWVAYLYELYLNDENRAN